MTTDRTSPFYDWPGEDHLGFWGRERVKSFVYVIQGHPKGPIKVGVAKDVRKRRASLQTGNHAPLRILLVVPGGYKLERQLHKRLAGAEVLGEWFDGPAVSGFLAWLETYSNEVVETCRQTGYIRTELKEPEKPKKPRSVGLRAVGGFMQPKLQQRWRVRSDDPAPVTVRFVEPNPKTPPEEAARLRTFKPLPPSPPVHSASLSEH